MFLPLEDDQRENGPPSTDERTALVEYLRRVRLIFEMKCSGLNARDGRTRGVQPSPTAAIASCSVKAPV
jgi:hypothetical protein